MPSPRKPTTFYRVQSNESQTRFWTRDNSFHATVLHDPSTLFDFSIPDSFPRLVAYAHMHLNNELMNTPFISLDCCPFSTLERAKLAEQKRRTGVFVAEITPSAEMSLWDARELAKYLDRFTAPEFQVIRRENWGFTKDEWLAINEIPSEAVGRIWTVQEFEDTLTQLSATYGKKRARKLPRIPTQISTLPISQQPPGSIDGSSLAHVPPHSELQDYEIIEQVDYSPLEGTFPNTEYSHFAQKS